MNETYAIGKKMPWLFLLLIAIIALSSSVIQAAQIPVLNWTQRSDWVNVVTAYGADPTGNTGTTQMTANTAAIQAAFTAATNGQTIYFPAGTYCINSTLTLTGTSHNVGIVLMGCGRNTILSWHGPSGGDMIETSSNSYGRYEGFVFQGNGTAGNGLHFYNALFVTNVRCKHLAFYNFTANGVFGDGGNGTASAEVSFENCIFNTCANGVQVYYWNEYDWTISGSDFVSCGNGVYCAHGNCYVRDCFFQGSTAHDIDLYGPEHGCSVRRCKSTGSAQFLWIAGEAAVQDCYVTGWTSPYGAIEYPGGASVTAVSHCLFLNPPSTAAPIQFYVGNPIVICNNSAPSSPTLISGPTGTTIYSVPAGSYAPLVGSTSGSAITTFVNQTVSVPSVVYDAVTGYSADPTGATDSTTAIQNCINAAQAHGSGAIAYLPKGTYKISSTLSLTGSNYVFGGSGWGTTLFWAGTSGGTMVSVANPSGITMENMGVGFTGSTNSGGEGIDIAQTWTTGTSTMTYDGVYVWGEYANSPGVRGLQLNGLSSSCTVTENMVNGNLTYLNSSTATVIADITYEGAIKLDDTGSSHTGFLGIQTRLSTNNSYGVTVNNSNNLVMSDWYQEQNTGGVSLNGVSGNPAGRITIEGDNTDLPSGAPFMTINNYTGKVFYGSNQMYVDTATEILNQTGTLPVEIVIFSNQFYYTTLSYSATSANVYTVGNWAVPDNYSTCTLTDMTPAFDDEQHLGSLDLSLNYPFVPV